MGRRAGSENMTGDYICESANDTFELGVKIGRELHRGELVLLYGGLGVGKTLLTKGILEAFDFDIDEVTSPSFSLVNLYKTTDLAIYHIDLWRLDPKSDPAAAVGLDEILEDESAVTIIEWADRLSRDTMPANVIVVTFSGDGDAPRMINIEDLRSSSSDSGEKI